MEQNPDAHRVGLEENFNFHLIFLDFLLNNLSHNPFDQLHYIHDQQLQPGKRIAISHASIEAQNNDLKSEDHSMHCVILIILVVFFGFTVFSFLSGIKITRQLIYIDHSPSLLHFLLGFFFFFGMSQDELSECWLIGLVEKDNNLIVERITMVLSSDKRFNKICKRNTTLKIMHLTQPEVDPSQRRQPIY